MKKIPAIEESKIKDEQVKLPNKPASPLDSLLDSLNETTRRLAGFMAKESERSEAERKKQEENDGGKKTDIHKSKSEVESPDETAIMQDLLHKMAYIKYQIQIIFLSYEGERIKNFLRERLRDIIKVVEAIPSPSYFPGRYGHAYRTNEHFGWIVTFEVGHHETLEFAKESLPALIGNKILIPVNRILNGESQFYNEAMPDSNRPIQELDGGKSKRVQFNLLLPLISADTMRKIAQGKLKFDDVKTAYCIVDRGFVSLDGGKSKEEDFYLFHSFPDKKSDKKS